MYSADYPLAIIGKWRIQILSVNYNNAKWRNVRINTIASESVESLRSASGKYHFRSCTIHLSYLKFQAYRLKFFNHWMYAAGLERIFLDAISFQTLCRFSLHDREKCDRENPTKGKQINKVSFTIDTSMEEYNWHDYPQRLLAFSKACSTYFCHQIWFYTKRKFAWNPHPMSSLIISYIKQANTQLI